MCFFSKPPKPKEPPPPPKKQDALSEALARRQQQRVGGLTRADTDVTGGNAGVPMTAGKLLLGS